MIPLKDSPRTRVFPYVNTFFILLNIFIFIRQLALTNEQLAIFISNYGLIPLRYSTSIMNKNLLAAVTPLISYQFLHASWLHIGSNMLYLWVFGDNIEDRIGHVKYFFFYLLMGTLAGLLQVYLDPTSRIPIIGASGAVAGVLGAYLISCPHARVLAIIPMFILLTVTEVPAVIFLGFWFFLQLFSGFTSLGVEVAIAWWAHIGGFVAGIALINFFGKRHKCE
ncbi:MAG: rhomboid family intramembrane serine protease [Firmicutes bacterium]|nr:rhomboid family intramembrane serine protease [Bacillota bacterium]